ncbi:hypothetical protein LIER_37485 [Lithospermum erythrorhizon]|uniref:RNase H type-1 domain-containing protein n=1 Tax=Lithospermum erythrorhizon TaxID=34254 RepID=A0AAV3PKZ9_LITER
MRLGLEIAYEKGWKELEMESDSKQLIQMLTGRQQITLELEVLVGDILHLAKLLEVKFQFACRSYNNVAHIIVHWDNLVDTEAT